LRKAEDIIDEEQNVLPLIAEMFGDREARQRNAGAGARRLVHLAVDQRAFGARRRAAMFGRVLVHAALDHFPVKVVAFAGALANAGEHRITAVHFGDVVDQFLNEHRLADARAAEETDLAAFGVGAEKVDNLDAGRQHFRFRRLLDERRGFLMDAAFRLRRDGAGFIHRLADDVHNPAERFFAHRHRDRFASVSNGLPAHEPFGRVHGDGAHHVFAQVLRNLQHQPVPVIVRFQRVQNARQVFVELNVDDSADNL
jgi:peptide chain release factor 1